jgi:CheY-like chemotaxis protein/nitrogen-specific signal transduction histidine kinase
MGEFRVVQLETGQFNLYGNEITHILDLQRAAEAANDAKSRFLSVMSHEIRTPLNAILGLTDLLMHEEASRPEQLRHLTYMEFSGKHLLSLVNDILDLEKLASSNVKKVDTDFQLDSFIHAIIDSFRNRAEKAKLHLNLSLAPNLPPRILSDVKWLTQILNNLIGNAIKYTDQGSVELRVERIAEYNSLKWSVIDTGKGIPQSEQERILQPFEQIRNDPQIEGTGLGLAIVSSLVKKLGGTLSIHSSESAGSTFSVEIPFEEPTENLADHTSNGLQATHQNGNTNTTNAATDPEAEVIPEIVLLADDNELNRFVASKLLQRWGYKVEEAVNGEEAVNKWQEMRPCIVLMDVQMPQMDGIQAATLIRQQEQKEVNNGTLARSPIIALTADAEEKTLRRILAAGMDDRIIKPFDPTALQAILNGYSTSTNT